MLIFWKSSLQIQMHKCGELNILCIGQLMAGKSTFLETYTDSQPSDEHFKIYLRHQRNLPGECMIYLHEIQERIGVDVYMNNAFDGVLFFVKIDDFHNTSRNVLESLALYSQVSGTNVYKTPIKIVVISSKNGEDYDDIGYGEKRMLRDEVSSLFNQNQIIYVESARNYQAQLSQFYMQLLDSTAQGIKESLYSNWYIRDLTSMFSFDQLKLQLMKLYEQTREAILIGLKLSPRKWQGRFF